MRVIVLALVLLFAAAGCASKSRISMSTGQTTNELAGVSLVARVKTALLNDPVVGRRRIDVQATDNDVRLTGRVATNEERDRAVSIARAVEGVRSVKSDLTIQP